MGGSGRTAQRFGGNFAGGQSLAPDRIARPRSILATYGNGPRRPTAPYPGFKPLDGSLGEYNGKFMCSQMTVRGGSCVSAARPYTALLIAAFFYPDARWQFLGIRLAKDGHGS